MSRWPSLAPLAAAVLLAGCGAKTGLAVDADGGGDAGPPPPPPPPADGGPDIRPVGDICVEVPYEAPPQDLQVSFVVAIRSAEVLFLMDTTTSMGAVVRVLRDRLRETILPRMRRTIPGLRASVASFRDFPPAAPEEHPDEVPFRLLQRSTTDMDAVEAAIEGLETGGGGDSPEAQVEALYQAATGEGIGPYVEPASCPPGTVGYPCLQPDGARIVLLFTDVRFHNGPDGGDPYEPGAIEPPPATYDEAVSALRAIGAKVLGLYSGFDALGGLEDMRRLARDTGAVTPEGEPLMFDIGHYADGLDEGLADAVSALVEEVPIDVELLTEDVPGDAVDATELIRSIRALRPEPPSGATRRDDRYEDVQPGTRVTFRLRLDNERVPPADETRRYPIRLVLLGDGVTRLEQRVVDIVVPGRRGGGCESLRDDR